MSDARRRRLEREVARGDPPARAALLGERARAGDLPAERLLLAAHLGDPDAREVVGAQPPCGDWFSALGDFGAEVALRAVLVVVQEARPFRRALEHPGARSEAAVEGDHAWAAAACRPDHRAAAVERARGLARQQQVFAERFGPGSGVSWHVGWTPGCACACAGVSAVDAPGVLARLSDPRSLPWLADAVDLTPARARAAIAAGLLGWALAGSR
ncbi:MAG: hypothetical protein M9894_35125 [Planctomycetes bacterium]|nr:hypothetical protein [Planctomycetota bacterium]